MDGTVGYEDGTYPEFSDNESFENMILEFLEVSSLKIASQVPKLPEERQEESMTTKDDCWGNESDQEALDDLDRRYWQGDIASHPPPQRRRSGVTQGSPSHPVGGELGKQRRLLGNQQ